MAEKPTSTVEDEAATQEESPEVPESSSGGGSEPEPINVAANLLTDEAKKEQEEESGKPIPDVPYSIVSEETLPQSTLGLKFSVPAESFQKELNRFYENLRKEVMLPGFRKGRAPLKLIRIRMGEDGDRDTMTEAATNVLRQEVLKRELKLVADPKIARWRIEDGEPLEFDVEFEVEPTVELESYKGLEVSVATQEVTDATVEGELERLRHNYGTQESAPKGTKISEETSIVIDLKVVGESGSELKHLGRTNWLVGNYRNDLPGELADAISGKNIGSVVEAMIPGKRTNRRGEEIQFNDKYVATIQEIKVAKLPELDDEFAKDLGEFDTLAELRDSIRESLDKREEERQRRESIARLLASLVEKNPLDPPRSMISRLQFQSVMEDSQSLHQMGLSLGDVVQDQNAYLSSRRDQAAFLCKQALLCTELARIEKLEVVDEDVEKAISDIAEREGRKALAVRARLEADKKLDTLRDELLQAKVNDFLLEHNTVKFEPAEPEEKKEEEAAEEEKKTKGKKAAVKKKPKKKAASKASPSKAKAKKGSK
ncbi:trigger factor, partial [Candidatus Sumerlaeota bacterium]|nr:trigger factor [Candidatus Sumerlaeota bacterium]